MSPAPTPDRALAEIAEVGEAARTAWDTVPDYLRQPKPPTAPCAARVEFSDRRTS